MSEPFPTTGRLAAVDFGTVRTGVAICDPDRILASPHGVFEGGVPQEPTVWVDLVREERLAAFVVGLPVHADGGESSTSTQARSFARYLRDNTGLPVRLFDERYTTVEAGQRIKSTGKPTRRQINKRIDAVAATILLEAFLESAKYGSETPGYDLDAGQADSL